MLLAFFLLPLAVGAYQAPPYPVPFNDTLPSPGPSATVRPVIEPFPDTAYPYSTCYTTAYTSIESSTLCTPTYTVTEYCSTACATHPPGRYPPGFTTSVGHIYPPGGYGYKTTTATATYPGVPKHTGPGGYWYAGEGGEGGYGYGDPPGSATATKEYGGETTHSPGQPSHTEASPGGGGGSGGGGNYTAPELPTYTGAAGRALPGLAAGVVAAVGLWAVL